MKKLDPEKYRAIKNSQEFARTNNIAIKSGGTQKAQECFEYFMGWDLQQCNIATPPPSQSEYSNFFSYLINRIGWGFTPSSSNRGMCLRQASKNYQQCLFGSGVSKGEIDPYTVSLSGGSWSNVHFLNGIGLNIQWNPIQLHRLIGCDGGIDDDGGYTQNPASKARTDDVLFNTSKGVILNTDVKNKNFCQCPINASFDLYEEKCKCNQAGWFTQWSKTKNKCCSPVDCNSPAINPSLVAGNVNTYKFYDCLSEKVAPETPAGAGRCILSTAWGV